MVSWQRPREQPLKNGGRRTAYPPAYAAGRAVWQAQVRFAVARTGWRPRPVAQALSVEAEVVAKGKLDTDRVTTAILDALEGGGALLNDCRVWRLHVVRRVPRADEAPHVEVVLGMLEQPVADGVASQAPAPREAGVGAIPGGDDAEKPGQNPWPQRALPDQ